MHIKRFLDCLPGLKLWDSQNWPVYVNGNKNRKIISVARQEFGPDQSDYRFLLVVGNAETSMPLTGELLAAFIQSRTKSADKYKKIFVFENGERKAIKGISVHIDDVGYFSLDI